MADRLLCLFILRAEKSNNNNRAVCGNRYNPEKTKSSLWKKHGYLRAKR
ncbi:hypothetical protein CSB69_1194 [Morganella morganii]|nr:hypothetical protein CSB69_1194 [Morganella morganii]EMP51641.1 hypothetical protein C790_00828 [Morganella morganii SC01]